MGFNFWPSARGVKWGLKSSRAFATSFISFRVCSNSFESSETREQSASMRKFKLFLSHQKTENFILTWSWKYWIFVFTQSREHLRWKSTLNWAEVWRSSARCWPLKGDTISFLVFGSPSTCSVSCAFELLTENFVFPFLFYTLSLPPDRHDRARPRLCHHHTQSTSFSLLIANSLSPSLCLWIISNVKQSKFVCCCKLSDTKWRWVFFRLLYSAAAWCWLPLCVHSFWWIKVFFIHC